MYDYVHHINTDTAQLAK